MTMVKEIKTGDTAGRIRMPITNGEGPQDLTGCTVVLKFSNGVVINAANGLLIDAPPTAGIVSYPPTPMNAAAEELPGHFVEALVTFGDSTQRTFPEGLDRPRMVVQPVLP